MSRRSPRRVLNVIQISGWGGVHSLVAQIGPLLPEQGWHMTCVLPDEDQASVTRLLEAGVDVVTAPMSRLRRTAGISGIIAPLRRLGPEAKQLAEMVAAQEPDVVMVNGTHHFLGPIVAKRLGLPLLWTIHSDQVPLMMRRLGGIAMPLLADSILTSGKSLVRQYPGLERFAAERTVGFSAPVDHAKFFPDLDLRTEAREELGVGDSDSVVFGTLGGRGPNKNHGLLVEAFARVHRDLPQSRLVIGGPPLPQHEAWYQENVSQRIAALPAAQREAIDVVFPDRRAAEFLNALDVFVLPSKGEGASLATAEALSCGVPAIVNDIGGLRDSVIEGSTGRLNRSCTAEELSDHMLDLGRDKLMRSKMGERGRDLAAALSIEACTERHVEALELAHAGRSRTRSSC